MSIYSSQNFFSDMNIFVLGRSSSNFNEPKYFECQLITYEYVYAHRKIISFREKGREKCVQ